MKNEQALNYSNYLGLDKILNAQERRSEDSPDGAEHDEMLFIIIHQVFELWFKQLLHEIDFVRSHLDSNNLGKTLHVLKRMRNIVKVMVGQVDVIETMTPQDFTAFRSRLDSASGLQSFQFREIEFSLGFKRESVLSRYDKSSDEYKRLMSRLETPSIWDAFVNFIHHKGFELPQELLNNNTKSEVVATEEVTSAIEKIYHTDPQLTQLCELLIDLDEGIQEWRYRHIKMVQRTIGMKSGTGGSDGVNYLTASLLKPIFPDLWNVRMRL